MVLSGLNPPLSLLQPVQLLQLPEYRPCKDQLAAGAQVHTIGGADQVCLRDGLGFPCSHAIAISCLQLADLLRVQGVAESRRRFSRMGA